MLTSLEIFLSFFVVVGVEVTHFQFADFTTSGNTAGLGFVLDKAQSWPGVQTSGAFQDWASSSHYTLYLFFELSTGRQARGLPFEPHRFHAKLSCRERATALLPAKLRRQLRSYKRRLRDISEEAQSPTRDSAAEKRPAAFAESGCSRVASHRGA